MSPAAVLAALLLVPAARADTVHVEVGKPGKTPWLAHDFVDAADGASVSWERGAWTWTAALVRMDYSGEARVCVEVHRLHPSKGRVEVGRPCVMATVADTPVAEVRMQSDGVEMALSWQAE